MDLSIWISTEISGIFGIMEAPQVTCEKSGKTSQHYKEGGRKRGNPCTCHERSKHARGGKRVKKRIQFCTWLAEKSFALIGYTVCAKLTNKLECWNHLPLFLTAVYFKTILLREMGSLVEEFIRRIKQSKAKLGEKHRKQIVRFWKLKRKSMCGSGNESEWLRISTASPHRGDVTITDL